MEKQLDENKAQLAANNEEMKTRFADIVGASRQENFNRLESVRDYVYGGLADGNVVSRVQETLDTIYDSNNNR